MIVLRQDNAQHRMEAKRRRLPLAVQDGWQMPAERVLFVGADQGVPWPLVESGFGALDTWEMACPLWRYGVLAQDVGTTAERERTKALCFYLRVPLMEPGLLFVRHVSSICAAPSPWRAKSSPGSISGTRRSKHSAFVRSRSAAVPTSVASTP